MPDAPTPPRVASKGLSKLKGLPPWAYVAAIGVGGAAIWLGINRANSKAAGDAADITGDYGGTLSATSGGDAFPVGSQGAGYYADPTTGAGSNDNTSFENTVSLLETLLPYVTGGGTKPSASAEDHYTPPQIIVNIPEPPAQPTTPKPTSPSAPGPAPDPCKGEYPYLQDNGPRKGKCYKIVLKGGKRYRQYKGESQLIPA